MTFTGTALDLPRLSGCVFGVTADAAESALSSGWSPTSAAARMWVAEEKRTPYHAGLAHGANHLVTLVERGHGDPHRGRRRRPRGHPAAAAGPRPSTTPSRRATPR